MSWVIEGILSNNKYGMSLPGLVLHNSHQVGPCSKCLTLAWCRCGWPYRSQGEQQRKHSKANAIPRLQSTSGGAGLHISSHGLRAWPGAQNEPTSSCPCCFCCSTEDTGNSGTVHT